MIQSSLSLFGWYQWDPCSTDHLLKNHRDTSKHGHENKNDIFQPTTKTLGFVVSNHNGLSPYEGLVLMECLVSQGHLRKAAGLHIYTSTYIIGSCSHTQTSKWGQITDVWDRQGDGLLRRRLEKTASLSASTCSHGGAAQTRPHWFRFAIAA